jgi:hypothetical protein
MRHHAWTMLIALALLTSAATAYAECAWVLWLHSLDTRSTLEIYDVDSAQATRQECDEVVARKATVLKGKGWDVVGGFRGSYEVLGTQGTRTMRYVCLPDTVDPRGPKGK